MGVVGFLSKKCVWYDVNETPTFRNLYNLKRDKTTRMVCCYYKDFLTTNNNKTNGGRIYSHTTYHSFLLFTCSIIITALQIYCK